MYDITEYISEDEYVNIIVKYDESAPALSSENKDREMFYRYLFRAFAGLNIVGWNAQDYVNMHLMARIGRRFESNMNKDPASTKFFLKDDPVKPGAYRKAYNNTHGLHGTMKRLLHAYEYIESRCMLERANRAK